MKRTDLQGGHEGGFSTEQEVFWKIKNVEPAHIKRACLFKHQRGQEGATDVLTSADVDRCQTCCLYFCFSARAFLDECGGPPPQRGGTAGSRRGRGQWHHCARPCASVNKMESMSWWTAQSWDYHQCRPTSAPSPLTCEYHISCASCLVMSHFSVFTCRPAALTPINFSCVSCICIPTNLLISFICAILLYMDNTNVYNPNSQPLTALIMNFVVEKKL